jgi:hypothetical protein
MPADALPPPGDAVPDDLVDVVLAASRALRRDGHTIPAAPDTIIEQGDRLAILLPAQNAADVDHLLCSTPATKSAPHRPPQPEPEG